MGDQPGVVVQEGDEKGAPGGLGVGRVGQVRPVEHVRLPLGVGPVLLVAPEDPLALPQLGPGLPQPAEVPGEGGELDLAGSDDGLGVELQDLDDLPCAAPRRLLAQGHRLFEDLRGQRLE